MWAIKPGVDAEVQAAVAGYPLEQADQHGRARAHRARRQVGVVAQAARSACTGNSWAARQYSACARRSLAWPTAFDQAAISVIDQANQGVR